MTPLVNAGYSDDCSKTFVFHVGSTTSTPRPPNSQWSYKCEGQPNSEQHDIAAKRRKVQGRSIPVMGLEPIIIAVTARSRSSKWGCTGGRKNSPMAGDRLQWFFRGACSSSHRPLPTQRICMWSRSQTAEKESRAGRTSRCIATGMFGSGAAL
jgi:hypothetical protein